MLDFLFKTFVHTALHETLYQLLKQDSCFRELVEKFVDIRLDSPGFAEQ